MEFARLLPEEQEYFEKNTLMAEMSLLNSIKIQRNYKRLRKEELAIKSAIKRILSDVKKEIKKLEAEMPKSSVLPKMRRAKQKESKRRSLETELETIKERLAKIQ